MRKLPYSTKMFCVRVPEEILERLHKEAAAQKCTITDLVIEKLTKRLPPDVKETLKRIEKRILEVIR